MQESGSLGEVGGQPGLACVVVVVSGQWRRGGFGVVVSLPSSARQARQGSSTLLQGGMPRKVQNLGPT